MFEYIEMENILENNAKGRANKLLTVGGMIGAGKTTITNIIAEELGFEPIFENVDNNEILPLFYTASPEDLDKYRYPFLLQLDFLDSRFSAIKDALDSENNVIMDRSIYEDWYFAKVNTKLGRISDLEFRIYEKLLNNMISEIEELPKKSPDLMIYLKISFEETLNRIGKRGRDFEQDKDLYSYYEKLWEGYDDWIMNHYSHSDILIIDMDKLDVEDSEEDRELLVDQIKDFYMKHEL